MYDLFSDFFDGFDFFPNSGTVAKEEKCPVCGHSYGDFQQTGRFGCSECYKTFRAPVELMLKQIHSNPAHTGKLPSHSGEKIKRKRQYNQLKQQLAQAVQNEDYEQAAKLHKQIRAMESEGDLS